ncbi:MULTISPECIES: hypothetical protein [Enterobacter]|uniref:hypothetical protein n=1 Tax=Enterobacter TaxID=547 RepID=UPI0010420BB2|nr:MULTISPECIES: hypothetical protein [Enterobacter]MBS0866271.1 hypothetical protein [Enterobacter mori]
MKFIHHGSNGCCREGGGRPSHRLRKYTDEGKKTKKKSSDLRKQTQVRKKEQARTELQKALLTTENRESMANDTLKMVDAFEEPEPMVPIFTDDELMIILCAIAMCEKRAELAGKPKSSALKHQLTRLDLGTERKN